MVADIYDQLVASDFCSKITQKGVLCNDCAALTRYARVRSDRCSFIENKTFCSNCSVHCYKPEMREIEPRDPILTADMFDTMLKSYNPNGDLPQYILGKADEDDYTGFPKIIMYFGGDEVFAGIAPDYEKSFIRCGVIDYQISIKEDVPHSYPVFTFLKGGREGEQEIIDDIREYYASLQ